VLLQFHLWAATAEKIFVPYSALGKSAVWHREPTVQPSNVTLVLVKDLGIATVNLKSKDACICSAQLLIFYFIQGQST
jgi:hypothetical protein